MPILKQQKARPVLNEAIVLDLGDLGRQAQRLRAAAQAQADAILADARDQAQRLIDGAHEQGFEQGRQEGHAQGLEEGQQKGQAQALEERREHLQQLQDAWVQAAQAWDGQRQEMDRQAREAVIEFALVAARKLVHRTIEVDPTVVVDGVGQALSLVLRPLDVTVAICPQDRGVLEQAMPKLLERFPHLTHVRLIDDESVTRGGCRLQFGEGQIDATIEKQLDRLVELIQPECGA